MLNSGGSCGDGGGGGGGGSVRSRDRMESGPSHRVQGERGWRVAVGGGKGRVSPPSFELGCGNRFSVLESQEEEEVVIEVGGGAGDRTPQAKVVKGRERKDRNRLDRLDRSGLGLGLGLGVIL